MSKQEKAGLTVGLFALPGAGKTTLAGRLQSELADQGYIFIDPVEEIAVQDTIRRLVRKLLLVTGQWLSAPLVSWRELMIILRIGQQSLSDLVKVTFNWFFARSLLRRARKEGQNIFLEGPLQSAWSVGLSAGPALSPAELSERLITLLSGVKLPDLIVILQVEEDQVREHLTNRPDGRSRLERPGEDVEPLCRRGQQLFEQLLKQLTDRKGLAHGCKVIVLKNNNYRQLDENTAYLREVICEQLERDFSSG